MELDGGSRLRLESKQRERESPCNGGLTWRRMGPPLHGDSRLSPSPPSSLAKASQQAGQRLKQHQQASPSRDAQAGKPKQASPGRHAQAAQPKQPSRGFTAFGLALGAAPAGKPRQARPLDVPASGAQTPRESQGGAPKGAARAGLPKLGCLPSGQVADASERQARRHLARRCRAACRHLPRDSICQPLRPRATPGGSARPFSPSQSSRAKAPRHAG